MTNQTHTINTIRLSLYFIILCTLHFFNAGAQPKSSGYTYKFKIKDFQEGTGILAHYYGENQYIPKDTAKADSKGNLVFSKKKELPGGVYLLVLPNNKYIELLGVEPSVQMEFDTVNVIASMKVKESAENTVFYEYQKFMNEKAKEAQPLRKMLTSKNKDSADIAKKKLEELDKLVKDFRENLFKTHAKTFAVKIFKAAMEPEVPEAPILSNGRKDSLFQFRYYKNHYWDNLDLADDRLIRSPVFHDKLSKYFEKLVLQIPDSINKEADMLLEKTTSKELYKYIVWWITNHYEKSNIMGMDAVFVHMANQYYLTGKAFWVDTSTQRKIRERAAILEPILIGKTAPNMYLTDSSGKAIPLSTVKSKVIVLYFWDPNCGHCQKETPKLHEYWEKNKDRGITVYAVSIDRKPDDWKRFIRNKGLKWINVWDSYVATDFRNLYDIYSTPVIYVLDEKKKIVAKRLGTEQLPEFIDNYFKDVLGSNLPK
jgi:peroxiredoxin